MCQFQGRDFLHIIKWFAINFHHFTFTHKIQIIRTRLHRDTCCILLSDYKNCYKGLRLVNYACDVHPFSWLYMQLLPAGGKTCFITFSFENQWFFFRFNISKNSLTKVKAIKGSPITLRLVILAICATNHFQLLLFHLNSVKCHIFFDVFLPFCTMLQT